MSQTIFITGASPSIGRATVDHFSKRDWNVVATMRNPDDGADLAERPQTLVAQLDLLEPDSIRSAVAAAEERFGGIDVLLNNAGYGAYGPLEATPSEVIRRQFDVNVGSEQFPATATVIDDGPRRDDLYAELVAISDQFAEYERMTDRRIPVVMLEPRG